MGKKGSHLFFQPGQYFCSCFISSLSSFLSFLHRCSFLISEGQSCGASIRICALCACSNVTNASLLAPALLPYRTFLPPRFIIVRSLHVTVRELCFQICVLDTLKPNDVQGENVSTCDAKQQAIQRSPSQSWEQRVSPEGIMGNQSKGLG